MCRCSSGENTALTRTIFQKRRLKVGYLNTTLQNLSKQLNFQKCQASLEAPLVVLTANTSDNLAAYLQPKALLKIVAHTVNRAYNHS